MLMHMIKKNTNIDDLKLEKTWIDIKDKVEEKCFTDIKKLSNDHYHENNEKFLEKYFIKNYISNPNLRHFENHRVRYCIRIPTSRTKFARYLEKKNYFYRTYNGLHHSPLQNHKLNLSLKNRYFIKIFCKLYADYMVEYLRELNIKCSMVSYIPAFYGSWFEFKKKVAEFFSEIEKQKGFLPAGEYRVNGVSLYIPAIKEKNKFKDIKIDIEKTLLEDKNGK